MDYDTSYVILLYILFFGLVGEGLASPSSANVPRNALRYFVRVANQLDLDRFIANVTTQSQEMSRYPMCIHLSLATNFEADSYQVDLTKLVLGVSLNKNDSLRVEVAEGGRANISCKGAMKFSKASLILFDGLLFTGCAVPVYVEEVDTVVMQNCVFR